MMKKMLVTSHFVAVSLKSSLLVDLFVELQTYLEKNAALSCIRFQNLLSLHISLYYLPGKLSTSLFSEICKSVDYLRSCPKLDINIGGLSYFKCNENDVLCYLKIAESGLLDCINDDFRGRFPNGVEDNQFTFVPHVSFFEIIDSAVFISHKTKIEEIIYKHLMVISKFNAFIDYNLYAVNSNYSPQIQVIVY